MEIEKKELKKNIDLDPSELVQMALNKKEGILSDTGALLVTTGARTGRSPTDRFIVKEASTQEEIDWGDVNRPFDSSNFDDLWDEVKSYLVDKEPFISHLHVLSLIHI